MLLDTKSKILLNTERAANDLRKGFPVKISGGIENIIAISPETVSPEILDNIYKSSKEIKLIITNNRLNYLKNSKNQRPDSSITINKNNFRDIAAICGLEKTNKPLKLDYNPASEIEKTALELVRIAELVPAVITAKLHKDTTGLTKIYSNDIAKYKETASLEIHEACRTKLVLKHSVDAEIIAFRPNIGGKEHYAIIIGNLSDAPLVRVHSSCYTGDLLDSLACDCHDQLHSAIELMHKKGGGIILYMLQEGRGIGLINKLRAYALKEQGLDTVDANEALGFDDDERLFEPAAQILKNLNIKDVQLLTNNPRKAQGLEDCGINVIECVPHIMETNEHNEQYIKTKSTRLGHKIGDNA